jgi:hypothetical protein
LSITHRRVETNLGASRTTKYYSPSTVKGVVPPLCTPTMESGTGYSIFLPDNGLRFPRFMSTRDGRDRIEDIVRQFIFSTNGRVDTTQ